VKRRAPNAALRFRKDIMQEYPKWRYHATEAAKIVKDPEHEDAAAHSDAGWVDHPSALVPVEDAALQPQQIDDSEATPDKKKTRKR
jgi:hypothetical protein